MLKDRFKVLFTAGVVVAGTTLLVAGSVAPRVPADHELRARATRDGLFPNSPRGADWKTYADYRWGHKPGGDGTYDKIPFWRDPTHDPDNGSHVVDYGGDARPGSPFTMQLSSLVDDSTVPGGDGKVLAITFPKDFPGGSAPARIFRHPRYDGNGLSWPHDENTGYLYIGVFIHLSRGWTTNGNVGQKLVYATSGKPPNRNINHIPLNLRTAAGTSGLFPAYEPQNPFGLYLVPTMQSNNVNDARWHLLEMIQEPNTPGRKNGSIRIFIDGRMAATWRDAMLFDIAHIPSLNSLSLNPVYGGGLRPVPATQTLEYGPLLVMGR